MNAPGSVRVFILGVIPAHTSPVAVLCDGELVEQSMLAARGDAIARTIERLRTQAGLGAGPCEIRAIVQDAPWPRTDAPATSAEVAKARSIAETAIRWAAICEAQGLRLALVRRATWIIGLANAGRSHQGPDHRIDAMKTARDLARTTVAPTHADAVCLAYWAVVQQDAASAAAAG